MDASSLWDNTKDGLSDAYGDVVAFGIGLAEAAIVLVLAAIVARWLKRRIRRALTAGRIQPNVAALAVTAAGIGVYIVAASVVLGLLGADWTALLAVLSVGTLAISLALQDVLKNFVAGVYLLLERPFSIGDRVRVRDVSGTIESIDFRTTVLRNEREERVLVPNATVFGEIITNRSSYQVGQTVLRLAGVTAPVSDLMPQIDDALDGVGGLESRRPRVEVAAVAETGVDATIYLQHPAGIDPVPEVIANLHKRFPEATIRVGDAP